MPAIDMQSMALKLVPAGGTAGQVLAKNSNTDHDLIWSTVASGGATGAAGGVLAGTYPNPSFATPMAPLASPVFTGVPEAPTAAAATNTTQLATTAFVFAERTNTATLTNKTLTSPIINKPTILNPEGVEQTLTDAATTAWDMDLGHCAKWNITATGRTLAPATNYKVGCHYQLIVKIDNPATMAPVLDPAFYIYQYGAAADFSTSTYTLLTMTWSTYHNKMMVLAGPGF